MATPILPALDSLDTALEMVAASAEYQRAQIRRLRARIEVANSHYQTTRDLVLAEALLLEGADLADIDRFLKRRIGQ